MCQFHSLYRYFYAILFVTTTLLINLTLPSQAEGTTDFTQVAKKAIPSVVSVRVESELPSRRFMDQERNDPFHFFREDDFWGHFFRIPQQQMPQKQIGQGSGFIISEDGYILTNNHIVREGSKIQVTLANGREYPAAVIGQDPSSDLAVIKIDAKSLPFLELGNSDDLEVGEWVVAIGNPMGLQATLTAGVVSATGRNNLGLTRFENFIQTDAAINLGNSGGPLMNLEGEVVGINTAIAAPSAGYTGIGFSIPSNMAKTITEQLIASGAVTRSYLGILLQEINNDLAEAFNLDSVQGALVADILPDSPAERSDLQPGDIILKINGDVVKNIGMFRNMVSMLKPGTKVNLAVQRGDQIYNFTIEVAPHPDNMTDEEVRADKDALGIKVEPLSEEAAKRMDFHEDHGVLVSRVEPGSLAGWAGIKKGAILISVNKVPVSSPEEYMRAIKNIKKGQPVILHLKQDGITRFVSLKEY
ncbi:MAG: DegQ family serine endoprotease [Chlamydiales bacterium]